MVTAALAEKFTHSFNQFAPFEDHPTLAVALSGGSDSLALLKLTLAWAKARQGKVIAFHVDHQLRPESKAEAIQVQEWCREWQVECHILPWQHGPVTTAIQQQARQARYALLEEACKKRGILHLLVAHHQEDQHETVAMRAEKKSGDRGMAGMSACVEQPFVRILRPLLLFSKAELLKVLEGHPFIEDPSNKNQRFGRARLRLEYPQRGVGEATLQTLQQSRQSKEAQLAVDVARCVELHEEGWALVKDIPFKNQEQKKFLWAQVLQCIGGRLYGPNETQVEELFHKMAQPSFGKTTCAGCYIIKRKEGYAIVREYPRVKPHFFTDQQPFLWDNRFFIASIDKNVIDLNILLGVLGPQGWSQIKNRFPESSFVASLMALPALWKDNRVWEVPFLGIYQRDFPLVDLQFRPLNAMVKSSFMTLKH